MSAKVFDGYRVAEAKEAEIADRVKMLQGKGIKLGLVSVVFKQDKIGQLYTRLKSEAAAKVGIRFEKVEVSFSDRVEAIAAEIREICARPEVSGLLIQKPSKSGWRVAGGGWQIKEFDTWWHTLTRAIDPKKDVDCLTQENSEKIYQGKTEFLPATVKAILVILATVFESLQGKKVVVVGRSEIVGKPLTAVLKQKGALVDLCGSETGDLTPKTSAADIVVVATGRPKLLTAEMVKPQAVVIDVGSPMAEADFKAIKNKASFITPVPGGVGPVTVVSLLQNLLDLKD